MGEGEREMVDGEAKLQGHGEVAIKRTRVLYIRSSSRSRALFPRVIVTVAALLVAPVHSPVANACVTG